MLDKLKVAFVLVVIGAISGFLIYGTNELTADTIRENRENQELDFYREIFELAPDFEFTVESNELENGLTEKVLIDSNQETIGYVYKGSDTNNYGDITVLVGITIEGNIKNVVISQATNTPTFVKKIKDKYLPNFVGQDVDSVNYDQRTGATHTYNSVSEVVELATTYFANERGVIND